MSRVLRQYRLGVEGKSFTSVIVDFPPAACSAPHRHGSPPSEEGVGGYTQYR
jgi:hypothetical protein